MKKEYLSILEEIKKNGGKDNLGELNDKVLIIDGLNTFIRCFGEYQQQMMMENTSVVYQDFSNQ